MRPIVLFLCPHGAAKSVLAAAYFQQIAAQQNLSYEALAAGTDPDADIAPAVAQLLSSEGFDVSGRRPVQVTEADLLGAFHIVSMGCDIDSLGEAAAKVERWDDVPPPSQNLILAREHIRERVTHLVTALSTSTAL